ncbi:hypothetical protein A3A75_03505 [Candidatus Woesebacteria bacterium RIFCSPLOWO2_01_FULL_39_10]|uniref:Uncharacterized protein n=1 Tax=Candidatus Woesebacteria bacterium RIFCSPLOWO2_01_FULL_39_10 TaxID=1802516 RepID=A0A1F8B935_9BACT|nr:MAG: hypothetical protein A3A75_03505 [Candidatus Woesebacteria bacterium RIFCSPLOWO2_01_FULL_39_10]
MRFSSILLSFLILLLFPSHSYASTTNQFITIVNPVRVSIYTQELERNLEIQNQVISSRGLPATWLLTYDAIFHDGSQKAIERFDKNQDIGLFIEITPQLAKASVVAYNDFGSWHHATSVFLSGYSQEERMKLIDTLFEAFKNVFGYYPSSVGAWWIDSFSLEYMKEKYGITGNLGLADQFSTDGYQVWGSYWSTPFYPSKYHAGLPASELSVKLDVVTIQWAPRDPYNGYFHSYYSTQDYLQDPVGEDTSYFEKLVRLYASKNNNEFGHITIGLESDLSPGAYEGEFTKQMDITKNLVESGEYQAITLRDFSQWYQNAFPGLSPQQLIETEDILGKKIKVFWYQSPKYRLGLVHNYETLETKIFDFRSYHANFQEPYYEIPNKEFILRINNPSYFDEISDKENIWILNFGKLKGEEKTGDSTLLVFEDGEVEFQEDKFSIKGKRVVLPDVINKSRSLKVSSKLDEFEIRPKDDWLIGPNGYVFRDLTDVATHQLKSRRVLVFVSGALSLIVIFSSLILRSKYSERKKITLLTFILFAPLIFSYLWYRGNSIYYYVSQAEVDSLNRLSILPPGRVLVYDKECLGCVWYSNEKPAVFSNKRQYVKKLGKHQVVCNIKVFEATNQKEAKEEFDKLKVDYIYVVKYGEYIEKVPFSPGDLNIEKVYENANAAIWRVKK